MISNKNYHFRVGDLHCFAINDCIGMLPGQCIVKDVPLDLLTPAFLERGISLSETTFYYNCLYLQAEQRRILVDAGVGESFPLGKGNLLEGLRAEGIGPEEIDTVIITHGDADHVGGIVASDGQLVFSKADYILSKDAWEFWSDTARVAKLPELLTVFGRKIIPLIRGRRKVIEAGSEFLPGFRLLSAPGHRPGHSVLDIVSSGESLLHLADAVGHPILIEYPAWHGSADSDHGQAAKDRFEFLGRAVAQETLVFGSHLPSPGVGHVVRGREGWRWLPLT